MGMLIDTRTLRDIAGDALMSESSPKPDIGPHCVNVAEVPIGDIRIVPQFEIRRY